MTSRHSTACMRFTGRELDMIEAALADSADRGAKTQGLLKRFRDAVSLENAPDPGGTSSHKVHQALLRHGPMPLSALTRHTRLMTAQDRERVIRELEANGEVKVTVLDTGGRPQRLITALEVQS